MTKRFLPVVLFTCVLVMAATPAAAQSSGWYAGAGLGVARVEFKPYYEYPAGTPDQYFDRANGVDVIVFGGRDWAIAPRFSLAVQGTFAYTPAQWSLTITEGEHSTITYDLGPSISLSAVPAVRVHRLIWITAEGGVGRAQVKEVKASTDWTRYAAEPWTWCYIAGIGARIDVAPRVRFVASYRYQRDASFMYHSVLPDGTQWETVTDKPVVGRVTAGFAFRF